MSNVELFRRVIERGFNEGDLSVADEVCAEKFSEHEYLAPTDIPGPEILKSQIKAARSEVGGLSITIEDIVADGDKVWARMVAKGSDVRSGTPIEMSVMDVCRFEDGMMVEHWGVPDRFAMLHQIGALPEPPDPPRG
ncbi:MAG: ester cyclase [Actinomycetota bacterium]|jgi:ketosteroid isomerase-like protein|nr:ester cyclase [Rubrobacter sp.]MDQ3508831.1 ester cyclase [Actinomycetota bacterium]